MVESNEISKVFIQHTCDIGGITETVVVYPRASQRIRKYRSNEVLTIKAVHHTTGDVAVEDENGRVRIISQRGSYRLVL